MAKFLTGNELNYQLEKLFEDAQGSIVLISPFIKLHDRYISALKTKIDYPDLEIIVVFGKNEDDISLSMQKEDFNFFKEFPNIEIRYEKRLHAKYYANESSAILTSMNLHRFSQDNNIEAGIMTKPKNIVGIGDEIDATTAEYFTRVIEQSELLFKKTPQFENKLLGLKKKYKESKIEVDRISDFFTDPKKNVTLHSTNSHNSTNKELHGYCIRTGVKIAFNPQKPLCDVAYQIWAQFNNKNFPEKYCHFSGEESYGETTYAKPILVKNRKKAKAQYGL